MLASRPYVSPSICLLLILWLSPRDTPDSTQMDSFSREKHKSSSCLSPRTALKRDIKREKSTKKTFEIKFSDEDNLEELLEIIVNICGN